MVTYPPRKQELEVEQVLAVPISQGSLAQMQRYFKVCFGSIYQQWLTYVPQPGVRCVDRTTYCMDGLKYWLWVATSDRVCVLLLAPICNIGNCRVAANRSILTSF